MSKEYMPDDQNDDFQAGADLMGEALQAGNLSPEDLAVLAEWQREADEAAETAKAASSMQELGQTATGAVVTVGQHPENTGPSLVHTPDGIVAAEAYQRDVDAGHDMAAGAYGNQMR